MPQSARLRIGVLAGEASGDILGSRVLAALKSAGASKVQAAVIAKVDTEAREFLPTA